MLNIDRSVDPVRDLVGKTWDHVENGVRREGKENTSENTVKVQARGNGGFNQESPQFENGENFTSFTFTS